jgi:hypothetical protein
VQHLESALTAFIHETTELGFELSVEDTRWLEDVGHRALHEGERWQQAVQHVRDTFWGLQSERGRLAPSQPTSAL